MFQTLVESRSRLFWLGMAVAMLLTTASFFVDDFSTAILLLQSAVGTAVLLTTASIGLEVVQSRWDAQEDAEQS